MRNKKTVKKKKSTVRRDYKDSVFRMVFQEKKELLSLYNAVNDTNYTEEEKLKVVTLQNAVYINIENDVAFLLGFSLNLYEHQSTLNPNMPLRDLFYVARELEGLIHTEEIYGRVLLKIPTPRFAVFYNGTEAQPEQIEMKLSDAFQKPEPNPELELKVTMYNINWGQNQKLAEKCQTLKEYMLYVARVRSYTKEMGLEEAVNRAVKECIAEGILAEFLSKNQKEAIAMSIFECDEERVRQVWERQARQAGREEGEQLGESRVNLLIQYLSEQNRTDEIIKAAKDREYQKELFAEFGL